MNTTAASYGTIVVAYQCVDDFGLQPVLATNGIVIENARRS